MSSAGALLPYAHTILCHYATLLVLQECLDRAAMVPAALNAVLYAFQPAAAVADVELHFLCMELFKQAASPTFLDAIFDAVAVVIDMVSHANANRHVLEPLVLYLLMNVCCTVLHLTSLVFYFCAFQAWCL